MDNLFDRPVALTIGPQRCGTSWIYDYLKARGDVCLPAGVKEIFYFDRHYQRGPEFYASHFNVLPQHKLVAELTTTAFDNVEAPDHVYKLLGAHVRLVCPLREPFARSKAIYLDYLKYGLVQGGIEQAVEKVPQILFASRYAEHLERWFTQFDSHNVHLVFYEALQHDPKAFAAGLCNKLGLPFMSPPGEGPWGRIARKFRSRPEPEPVLDPADEAWLRERLAPETARLERLIGKSLTLWKT